ncbi:PHA/PHB synthase family protein [Brevirhabdus sp.]|uniref:PHA/PHB synthase family protein n=1 Tax=Brevirhabdus sp. TaxID=2004514 RepID=UPI00405A0009
MATDDDPPHAQHGVQDLERLNANLAKMDELSKRLVAAISHRRPADPGLQGPGSDLYMKAATAYMGEMMSNPARIIETQAGYWGKVLSHFVEAGQALGQGRMVPDDKAQDGRPADRRFANPLWQTHPYFNYIKNQYLTTSDAIREAVQGLEGLDGRDQRRVEFFAQQIIDMMAPPNFLGTNPDALERAVATDGQSLVRGMENLVRDIEANDGDLLVTLADREAFVLGENLAATEGSVVFRNEMFELIQYAPTTDKVKAVPLVLFPPWINKFYILDLKPQNSLIKWVVDQGYTLFVVSWVNPDASYADVGMDGYVRDGVFKAIEVVKEITAQPKVNAVGYCIAGTTLALSLARMNRTGDKSVRSATFFTTMTDFADQGEMSVFLDDDFVSGIERQVAEDGLLHSFFMSRTFSYLRSNDLIYQPAIRSYMMGEAPPAFDLLYWNGDSTNLPGRMAMEYLRGLCQDNQFATDGFEVLGEKVTLRDVNVPVFAVACETDHIAAWKSSFCGVSRMGGRDKTFVLSQSGHIAGIVNPPSRNKYGHYISDTAMEGDPDAWREGSEFHPVSWWPRWIDWLSRRSGKMVDARTPGSASYPVRGAAPGTYVLPTPKE